MQPGKPMTVCNLQIILLWLILNQCFLLIQKIEC